MWAEPPRWNSSPTWLSNPASAAEISDLGPPSRFGPEPTSTVEEREREGKVKRKKERRVRMWVKNIEREEKEKQRGGKTSLAQADYISAWLSQTIYQLGFCWDIFWKPFTKESLVPHNFSSTSHWMKSGLFNWEHQTACVIYRVMLDD